MSSPNETLAERNNIADRDLPSMHKGRREHDASHKFHMEMDFDRKQLNAIETGAAGIVIGAVAGIVELKTGQVSALASKAMPLLDELGTAMYAKTMRLANLPPRTNYFELRNGLEVSLSQNVKLYGVKSDVVSLVDRAGNEAHLYSTGSRTVVLAKQESMLSQTTFFDQAKVGIHMSIPSDKIPSVGFQNKHLTVGNIRLYNRVANSLWTGYTKPLERIPDLLEQASRY